MTQQFLWGALTMSCVVAGLFFLRFYMDTRDRLFALFAVAFALLAVHWAGLAVVNPEMESRHLLFLLRLAAFSAIIAAVVDRNRRKD